MSSRLLVSIGLALATSLIAQTPVQPSKNWTAPRTADGHPDFQGVWTNATLTPMDRPKEFDGKATASEAEARAYEQKDLSSNDIDRDDAPILKAINGSNAVAGYNNLFLLILPTGTLRRALTRRRSAWPPCSEAMTSMTT
jgi:hypothetical protein